MLKLAIYVGYRRPVSMSHPICKSQRSAARCPSGASDVKLPFRSSVSYSYAQFL